VLITNQAKIVPRMFRDHCGRSVKRRYHPVLVIPHRPGQSKLEGNDARSRREDTPMSTALYGLCAYGRRANLAGAKPDPHRGDGRYQLPFTQSH
jgi:hypothetical protein